MKSTITLLLAFALTFTLALSAKAQSAREVLKNDPQISAESSVDLDKFIDEVRNNLKEQERTKARNRIQLRIDELFALNPTLKAQLLNESVR